MQKKLIAAALAAMFAATAPAHAGEVDDLKASMKKTIAERTEAAARARSFANAIGLSQEEANQLVHQLAHNGIPIELERVLQMVESFMKGGAATDTALRNEVQEWLDNYSKARESDLIPQSAMELAERALSITAHYAGPAFKEAQTITEILRGSMEQ